MTILKYAKLGSYVVKKLANIAPNETVLLLGDTGSNKSMMDAIMSASIGLGVEVQMLMYPERNTTNVEPSRAIAEAMKNSDVIIDLSVNYFIHTQAYDDARTAGARALVTIPPGIEEYINAGVVGINYEKMVKEGQIIADLFEKSKKCKVISEEGTHLEMNLGERPAVLRDGMVVSSGEIDYFPGAQVSLAPLEDSMNGKIVANGSIYPPIGKLSGNVEIQVEEGTIVEISGSTDAQEWKKWLKSLEDREMYNIAHFSIGFNPNANLRGYIIEDERIRGSVTCGFGSQMIDFKGKYGKAKSHTDVVSLFNTVFLDDKKIVENGNILVDDKDE